MKTKQLLAVALCLSVFQAHSTEFFVTNNQDSGTGSLRQALLDATTDTKNNPHVITPDATYQINLESALPKLDGVIAITFNGSANKTVTIKGDPSLNNTTLLAIQSAEAIVNYFIFDRTPVTVNNNPNATFNHCSFINAVGAPSFRDWGSSVVFNDCIFSDNKNTTADQGSAYLGNNTSNTTFNRCFIAFNEGSGGAAIVSKYILKMNNCIVANNKGTSTSTRGGGIHFSRGACELTNCWIVENTAPRGGGITIAPGTSTHKPTLTMIGCTVERNVANLANGGVGGGVYIQGGDGDQTGEIVLTNCTISDNTATMAGGGINIGGYASASSWKGNVTLNNCTITRNLGNGGTTKDVGGGVSRGGGTVTCNINYCIIAGNNYNEDPKFNDSRDLDPYSPDKLWVKSQTGRNLYYGKAMWQETVTEGNIELGKEIDIASVLDSELKDNGGPLLPPITSGIVTRIKTYALVANSPAINPSASPSGLQTVDQRGYLRNARPDMGAYESDGVSGIPNVQQANNLYQREGDAVTFLTSGQTSFIDLDGSVFRVLPVEAGQRIDLPKEKYFILLFNSIEGFVSEKVYLFE